MKTASWMVKIESAEVEWLLILTFNIDILKYEASKYLDSYFPEQGQIEYWAVQTECIV